MTISRLEEEKRKHLSHLVVLEERLADLELQSSSAESRLSQRNTALTDLQRDLEQKASRVTQLEREVSCWENIIVYHEWGIKGI